MRPKRKSIYRSPKRYAKRVGITLRQARIICRHQNRLARDVRKATKCPRCKHHELFIEHSDSEYSTESWVQCGNCDTDFELEEHPNSEMLQPWYDYDAVLETRVLIEDNITSKDNFDGFVTDELIKLG